MATRDAVTWFVRCCSRVVDASQWEEEASQAADYLHQPTAPAVDQEVSADPVPRSPGESRISRVARTNTDPGEQYSNVVSVFVSVSVLGYCPPHPAAWIYGRLTPLSVRPLDVSPPDKYIAF